MTRDMTENTCSWGCNFEVTVKSWLVTVVGYKPDKNLVGARHVKVKVLVVVPCLLVIEYDLQLQMTWQNEKVESTSGKTWFLNDQDGLANDTDDL